MIALQLILPVLSLLVLGAHFLRSGNLFAVAAVVAVACLLAVRRPWAARLAQSALVLGAAEWVRTLIVLASERMREGQPAARMAIILVAAAAAALVAAFAFQGEALRRAYGLGRRP